MRFLLYSHDGMGLGHVRRHLAIASALTSIDPGAQVLLATSIDEVSHLGLPSNVDTLKLPGLRKVANQHYASRRLSLDVSEMRALRSALLETAVHSFHPDVLVVDKHPLGAAGEIQDALDAAKAYGAKAVLGLRDILDEPQTVLKEWATEHLHQVVEESYDLVLVYGVRSVFDPVDEYRFTSAIAHRTRFCGYVVNACQPTTPAQTLWDCNPDGSRRVVVGTTGGGEDGFKVLSAFIEAAAGATWKGVAIAGPLLAQENFKKLEQMAGEAGVDLHRFIPCLSDSLWTCDALVCMGGYNTLAEAVSTGIPTVCIPRVRPRAEQWLRAQAFERLGLLRSLHPDALTADQLRQEVDLALDISRDSIIDRANLSLNFDGTRSAARLLLELEPGTRQHGGSRLAPGEPTLSRYSP